MPPRLIIGNKAYSSWSLRPWLLLKTFGIDFDEVVIPLFVGDWKSVLAQYSPAGKVPVLVDGEAVVWESLAIFEYIAEAYAHMSIWPRDRIARAHARALCAEMHAGFAALRAHCCTNFRRAPAPRALTPEVEADVARIEAAWDGARQRFGHGGPFLFGKFSAADAMFAPVVNRFHVYEIPVGATARAYMKAIQALPAWREWIADAAAEPWRIEAYEHE